MEKQSDGTKIEADIIIRNTVENVSKLDAKGKSWTHDCMFNLKWIMQIRMLSIRDTTYLRSLLCPTNSNSHGWSAGQVSAEFCLLSHKEGQAPLTEKSKEFFNWVEKPVFRVLCMIPMQKVLDPENGYIQNDAIKFQININMDSMFPLKQDERNSTCDYHQPDLVKNYRKIYEEKLFTDFVIKTRGQEYKVHKAVLAACSPVFKAMVLSEMIEKTEGRVTIDDFSANVVEQLIQFFYIGILDTGFGSFIDLYVAAEKYDVPELQKICEDSMISRMSCSDAIDILIHSKQHDRLKLKRYAVAFILRHAYEIVQLPAFELMCEDHVDLAMIIMRHMSVFTRKLSITEEKLFE